VSWRGRINASTTWRVGQFKQPNSLEELTSTRSNEFISKAAVTNAFAAARRIGGEVQYAVPKLTATATYFTREINVNQRVGNGFGGRLTYAPIDELETFETLHFGLSFISQKADNRRYNLASRAQADISSVNVISAALTDADRTQTAGLEAMYFKGPFKVMGEYYSSTTSRLGAAPDFSASGYYVAGLYTLGEDRFSYRNGVFNTALPSDPVKGLWQFAARYDALDANDGSIRGGELKAATLGVNWYIRSNFKLSFNYVIADSARSQNSVVINNDPKIAELRFQIGI
jgi:phosphate-selective porin OprO and OprP